MVSTDPTIRENPYSWNREANVVYLEQPVGVGFSYSDSSMDYSNTNDALSAMDLNGAVRDFLKRFPKYLNNDVFLAGENYAGIVIPLAAMNILEGNTKGQLPIVHLKGIMVGNGFMDDATDCNNIPLMMKNKNLISSDVYDKGFKDCKGDFYANQNWGDCSNFLADIKEIFKTVNPHFMDDKCGYSPMDVTPTVETSIRLNPLFKLRFSNGVTSKFIQGISRGKSDASCVPNAALSKFFNHADVRKALGITREPIDDFGWGVCSISIKYSTVYDSVLPFYAKIASMMRVLIYSGDSDITMSYIGTSAAVDKLKLGLSSDWKA